MFWAWASPASQSLTFIDKAWAGPAFQSLTFIDRNPSLLSTGPGQPGHPTPHFYWPDPSVLSAKPARPNPKNCEPPEPPGQLLHAK